MYFIKNNAKISIEDIELVYFYAKYLIFMHTHQHQGPREILRAGLITKIKCCWCGYCTSQITVYMANCELGGRCLDFRRACFLVYLPSSFSFSHFVLNSNSHPRKRLFAWQLSTLKYISLQFCCFHGWNGRSNLPCSHVLEHFVANLLVDHLHRQINPVLPEWVANHDHELQQALEDDGGGDRHEERKENLHQLAVGVAHKHVGDEDAFLDREQEQLLLQWQA